SSANALKVDSVAFLPNRIWRAPPIISAESFISARVPARFGSLAAFKLRKSVPVSDSWPTTPRGDTTVGPEYTTSPTPRNLNLVCLRDSDCLRSCSTVADGAYVRTWDSTTYLPC